MTSGLTLEESTYQGLVYLMLGGEIDTANVDTVGSRISHHLRSGGVNTIVIDLAAVTSLDPGAVEALLSGRRLAAQAAAGYRVINAQGRVREVLDMSGAVGYLDTEAVLEDAG